MVSYRRLAMRVLGHVPVPFGKKKAAPPPRVAAQRIAALALACAMMTGMTLPAFAATYDIASGSIDIHATENGNLISQWFMNGEQKEYVSDSSGYIQDREDNDITITGTSTGNTVTIDADKDQTANVTLDNVEINASSTGQAAVDVTGSGNTNIELNGDNTLTGGNWYAGLQHNKETDAEGNETSGKLTITDTDNDGKLTATGDFGGAGIGGGNMKDAGKIEITGGSITATGGLDGAGIGGGGSGGDADITISGGTINAIGGTDPWGQPGAIGGAGIGGGGSGGNATVTITGGAGGLGDVTITDDATIKNAQGGDGAAGIGGGAGGLGDVDIEGKVTIQNAQGGIGAAGIGGGAESEPDDDGTGNKTGNKISIQGTEAGSPNITAKGGKASDDGLSGGAAIGSGSVYENDPQSPEEKAPAAITIEGKVTIDATAGGKLADNDAIAIGDALTEEQKFAGLPVGAVITRKDLDGKDLTQEGDKPTEPEKPEPEKPEPEKPEPEKPEPEKPEPEKPEPEKPEPEKPEPEKPEPEKPEPEKPEPEKPEPEKPEPEKPEPEKPEPEKPEPEKPDPEKPEPEKPEKPDPENPNPEQPNPNPEQPSEPSGAVSTSAPAEELTASDAEYLVTVEGLSVTNALEKQITHTCTQNVQGKVLTIRVNSIVATAHLTMETLRTLKAQGGRNHPFLHTAVPSDFGLHRRTSESWGR